MTTVVDASVAIRWYVDAPGTHEACTLLESHDALIAPDLLVAEVGNVAWKLVRSGAITREHGSRIAAAVPSVFTRLLGSASLASRALEIANAIDHPVNDCLYLALAETEKASLITYDLRLANAVRGTDWEPLVQLLDARP